MTTHYMELRYPDGKMAARYDPIRGLLELQKSNVKYLFDLVQLAEQAVDFSPGSCYTTGSSFGDELKIQSGG